jgi:hypothetical protein
MKSRIRGERVASVMCWGGGAPLSPLGSSNAGKSLVGIDELHRAAMRALEQQRRLATARYNCALADTNSKIPVQR